MTHLELENLASDYLEGQLVESQRVDADLHLQTCPACRELMGDLKRVLSLAHAAEDMEPSPWLAAKIMRATVGERKPGWKERLAAILRPTFQPRVAYTVAMAMFSISIIVNAAGLNLRNLTMADLNPQIWLYQANRSGQLMFARAEKFYYDLRIVYEIESRFRQNQKTSPEPAEQTRPESTPGGSSQRTTPGGTEIASAGDFGNGITESIALASHWATQGRSTSR